MKRSVLLSLGLLNVGLGVAGIFLPLLPTTPFLLLAAFLFARSSSRWHRWLLAHPRLGPYIHAFRNRTGLTVSQKCRIAASMTVMLGLSAYFSPVMTVRLALAALWVFWLLVLFRMRTAREAAPNG